MSRRRVHRASAAALCLAATSVLASGCGANPDSRRARRSPVQPRAQVQLPVRVSVDVRVKAWKRLSSATSGRAVESAAPKDVPELITRIFDEGIPEGPVDVVFVVDTTGSMRDDIDAVKADIRTILSHLRDSNPDYRIGLVGYRDIHDEFLTRSYLFLSADDARIKKALASIRVHGGDDWREHVYAGIHTALGGQPWRPDVSQHIILMGDAPPHDDYENDPRNFETVTAEARAEGRSVKIHTIGIQCDATCKKALARENEERRNLGRIQY